MQANSRTQHKTSILVEISLTDGSTLRGKLFAVPQGRLVDVLNDERNFLPVENLDGTVTAIAKSAIRSVALPGAVVPVYRGNDPYMILGVTEGVSEHDLKQAYHQLSMINHPDRIKGFGLGTDFQELANNNMVRLNGAYMEILRRIKAPR